MHGNPNAVKFLRYILCPDNMDHQWTIIHTAIVYCYYYNLNDSYVIINYSHDKANCHDKYLSSNSAIIVCIYTSQRLLGISL